MQYDVLCTGGFDNRPQGSLSYHVLALHVRELCLKYFSMQIHDSFLSNNIMWPKIISNLMQKLACRHIIKQQVYMVTYSFRKRWKHICVGMYTCKHLGKICEIQELQECKMESKDWEPFSFHVMMLFLYFSSLNYSEIARPWKLNKS